MTTGKSDDGGRETTSADGDTNVRVEGRAGRITLNRPAALNALTYAQVGVIARALDAWEADTDVAVVIIDAAGGRAFCAGGDIRELYDARTTDPMLAARFWRDEYTLNARIHRYPKPIVTLMDGLVMGGGIGLAAHASHRVVTEHADLAMPETAIGLVPDVGGTWLLARAPGQLGALLGLTGGRFKAADAIYAGFADTHVARDDVSALVDALVDPAGAPVGVVVAEAASAPAPATYAMRQTDIDRLCGGDSVADIQAALRGADDVPWAERAARDMKKRSPLALIAFLAAVRGARHLGSLE
ncbi:MAG: 3-hydroxyisobutyryl-CoA hydrolase, partial [Pseudomonadota bacterium]